MKYIEFDNTICTFLFDFFVCKDGKVENHWRLRRKLHVYMYGFFFHGFLFVFVFWCFFFVFFRWGGGIMILSLEILELG